MKRLAFAGLALLLTGAGPAADPTPPGPDRTSAVFGDWEARCELHAGASPTRVCELVQGVVDREHRPILTLAVKPAATADTAPILLVQMPVNVSIAGEMNFAFDKTSPPVPVKLQVCVASGCFAAAELNPTLRDRLSAWGDKPASFNFVSASQAHVQVQVSWRGFGEAWAALGHPAP